MIRRHVAALCVALCVITGGLARAQAPQPQPVTYTSPNRLLVLLRMPAEHLRPSADYSGNYDDPLGRSARRRIADRLARAHGLVLEDGWPMPLVGMDCFIMDVPVGASAEAIAAALSRDRDVAFAEVSHMFRAHGATPPRDPLFLAQPVARAWRLDALHRIATGRDVVVAVVDSTVDQSHPDLAGQVLMSENFVADRPLTPEAHGTGVAGIIAARSDNGVGITGIAPGARLMALRACWETPDHGGASTVCDTLSLAKALHYAIEHKAQVINLSLGGPADLLLGKLIDVAEARGIRVVTAYDRNTPQGGFPASHPGVIAVADEALAPLPADVYTAPGRGVPTTQPGGRWYLVNGSSYAAAHVSGLIALMRERRPRERSAPVLVARPGDGVVDACASLLRVSADPAGACTRVR